MKMLFTGFYPRIHDQNLPPRDWLSGYVQTYLERDVRNVLAVGDLETFNRFLRLCAGRSGQLLNLSGLAADCGLTHTTVRRWLSILEASFIVILLRPHFKNFGKRLIKSPKLYFLDTGLLCFLLQIRSAEELYTHSARGAIFESLVCAELYKNFVHRGELPTLYFWRDSAGHEVDFLVDTGQDLIPVEAKSGQTIAADFFDNINYWRSLGKETLCSPALVYGGNQCFVRNGVVVYPWFAL
jgi:predicted AAA+ superfamily ATPase